MVVASGQARLELRRDPKTPVARNHQKLSTERTERIRRGPMRLRSARLDDLLPVYGERMMRDRAGRGIASTIPRWSVLRLNRVRFEPLREGQLLRSAMNVAKWRDCAH
jgi:hypothetical protein